MIPNNGNVIRIMKLLYP